MGRNRSIHFGVLAPLEEARPADAGKGAGAFEPHKPKLAEPEPNRSRYIGAWFGGVEEAAVGH